MAKNYRKLNIAFADDPEMLRRLADEELTNAIKKKTAVEIALNLKKGDKGDTPKKGVDYFTKQEVKDIAEYVKDTVKEEVRPRKGKDYFDGISGRDGKDADETKILKKLIQEIPTAGEILAQVKVPQPKEIDQEELIKKILKAIPEPKLLTFEDVLKELKKKPLLDLRDIKGARLDGRLNGSKLDMNDQRWHGGGLSTVATDGVTITGDGTPGNPLIATASGSGDVVGPAGAVDSNFAAFNTNTGKLIKDSGFSSGSFLKLDQTTPQSVVNGAPIFDAIDFDTTPALAVPTEGRLQWNATDGTLDLGMNGGTITQQIGQEMFMKVRNVSGSTITNGTPVYISGRTGNRPNIYPAQSNAEATSGVIGIVTEDVTSPNDGFVTTFGYVRQIKTNYSGAGNWGTTWVEGDHLYVSKTVAGQLTNVEPAAPHHSDIVGFVGIVGGIGVGSIFININEHRTLTELTDVDGTALTTTGQFPVWDNVAGYFDFTSNISDFEPTIAAAGPNTVWHGDKTFSAVVEADITLSDNTTNNVSTLKHGFMSKLPGTTTIFYRGDGTFAAPAATTVPNAYVIQAFTNTTYNLVHNLGSYPIVQVLDSTGAVVIPLSIVNNTANDLTVTFTTSGTYTIIATLGSPQLQSYVATAIDYSALVTDRIIEVTGAAKTITLPTANVTNVGYEYKIDNSSSGSIFVVGQGGETIQGQVTQTIPPNSCLSIYANGTAWRID